MLTTAQATTLRTDVKAQGGAISTAYAAKNTDAIAAAYNLPASPDYWIWRASVTMDEYVNGTSLDATAFSWSAYIARSQGERDAFRTIFMSSSLAVNPSLSQVRAGFADIFSGAGGAATRTHMLAMSRKLSSIFAKLYAVGSGTTANPSTVPTALIDYILTSQDAHDALFDGAGNPI